MKILKKLNNNYEEFECSVRKKIFAVIFFAVTSIMITYLLSYSTSPLYGIHTSDSSMFAFIGKQWLSGYIPYRDVFDHKGPVIFFINMLGFLISDNSLNGILYIQMGFMFVSHYQIYIFLRKNGMGIFSYVIPAAFPFIFDKLFSEWNLTEEYIFPFLILSYFLIYKYSKKMHEKVEIPPVYVFFFGLTCAFALMTRATNCIGVAFGCIFIAVNLIIHHRWQNLLKGIFAFFIGMAVLVVPFAIYFASKGCTYEFWYGTLIFNFLYTQEVTVIANHACTFLFGFPVILCILTEFMSFVEKRNVSRLLLWLFILVPHIFYYYNLTYYHYFAISIPFLFISIVELKNLYAMGDSKVQKIMVRLVTLYGIIFCCIVGCLSFEKIMTTKSDENKYSDRVTKFEEVYNLVPEAERNNIMLYTDLVSAGNYLDYNIFSDVKYFACQSWHELMNEEHKKEMEDYYIHDAPKYVIKPQFSNYVPDEEWYTYTLIHVTDKFDYYGNSIVYTLYEKKS